MFRIAMEGPKLEIKSSVICDGFALLQLLRTVPLDWEAEIQLGSTTTCR